MKLKKKEDQSVDISLLLRIGNKIPMEGVTETKFGAEVEERTIQRLPHLGIHPIADCEHLLLFARHRHSLKRDSYQGPFSKILLVYAMVSAFGG